VGTEVNMVRRFAANYADRQVVPLAPSLCPNMWATTPAKMLSLIRDFPQDHRITVDPEVAANARQALERMFAVVA